MGGPIHGDIAHTQVVKELHGSGGPSTGVVAAGFPCQPYWRFGGCWGVHPDPRPEGSLVAPSALPGTRKCFRSYLARRHNADLGRFCIGSRLPAELFRVGAGGPVASPKETLVAGHAAKGSSHIFVDALACWTLGCAFAMSCLNGLFGPLPTSGTLLGRNRSPPCTATARADADHQASACQD